MLPDKLFFSSISELAVEIRARRLSPVELAEGYLDRLEKFGPRLGAVATVMRESGLREAHAAEREIRRGRYRGPLHGIPYGAKDLLATREAKTTWGATPYKDQRFDYDATVIRKLRRAGAVLVAKLAMIELAGGMNYNQAVEHRLLERRIVLGLGLKRSRRPGRLRHRIGNLRFDHHPGRLLRRIRFEAHLRLGVASRRDGPFVDAR